MDTRKVVRQTVAVGASLLVCCCLARPQEDPRAALVEAIRTGDVQTVREQLKAGVNPNPLVDASGQGEIPLILAARLGHAELVQALLDAKADPRFRDANDKPALFYAVDRGFREVVGLLLNSHGSTKSDLDDDMFVAVRGGFADILRAILQAGANPNLMDANQFTPIMLAAKAGRLDLVTELLAHGADPDFNPARRLSATVPGAYGVPAPNPVALTPTALILAVQSGHAEIVSALLDAGADPTVADNNGKSALALARESGQTAMTVALQSSWEHFDPFGQRRGMDMVASDIDAQLRLAARRLEARPGPASSVVDATITDWEYLAGVAKGNWDAGWQDSLRFILSALTAANNQQSFPKSIHILEQVAADLRIKAESCRLNNGALVASVPVLVNTERNGQKIPHLQVCSKPEIMEFVDRPCFKPFDSTSTPAGSSLVPGFYLIAASDLGGHRTKLPHKLEVRPPEGAPSAPPKAVETTLVIDW